MTDSLSLREVAKVTVSEPWKGPASGSWNRCLYIYTKDGRRFEIDLWSEKHNSLLIKAEE